MIRLLAIGLAAWLVGCGGLGGGDASGDGAGDSGSVKNADTAFDQTMALDDPAYRFCHVPGADAELAREWCSMLEDAPEERCPGLRATCEDGAALAEELTLPLGGCGGEAGSPTSKPAPAPQKPANEPMSCETPEYSCDPPQTPTGWLVALLKWVSALIIALVVLVILRLMFKWFGTGSDSVTAPVEEPLGTIEDEAPTDVPDAPSEDLLTAAVRAFEAGNWGAAVWLSRGAALRRLGEAGRIKLHRARTDREYLRTIRRDADVHEPLQDVLSAAERHRWGGAPLQRGIAERVIASTRRLLQVVGATAVVLLFLVAAGGGVDRYGPDGDAALFELYSQAGFEVSWRLRGLASLDEETDVLVLDLTGVIPGDPEWEGIRAWVGQGGILLVGGDASVGFGALGTFTPLPPHQTPRFAPDFFTWLPLPDWPEGPAWGMANPGGRVWIETGGLPPSDANRTGVDVGGPPALTTTGITELTALVEVLDYGGGHVIAIADAQLLYNGALVSPNNEMFLGSLFHFGQAVGHWFLDDEPHLQLATLSQAGSDNPVGALADARLLPLVLQLLALIALGALWKGWPFGPLRDPPDVGRHKFSEHITALGGRYGRLGASRYAASAYARLWLNRLGLGGLERAAERAGYSTHDARELVTELQAVADVPEGPNKRRDLELMEELWKITERS